MPQVQSIDPALLSSISHLELIAKKAVEGAVSGLHHSHYKGRNIEFSEHRPYNPGDELRHIDWRVYAKTNRFHVKLFEEDTNLRATLLLDISGSMGFTGEGISKAEYARQFTAALSYLILNQGDSAGLILFDKTVRSFVPPGQRSDQWVTLMETMVGTEMTHDESEIGKVLSGVGEFIRKRGMVIILSDLIDQHESVLKSLTLLSRQQHEIVVFHLLTPEEIDLPYHGSVEFLPMEGDEASLLTAPRRLQKNYLERVQRFIETYRNGCLELGIDYQLVRTDQPLELTLREYLQRRMKSKA